MMMNTYNYETKRAILPAVYKSINNATNKVVKMTQAENVIKVSGVSPLVMSRRQH